MDGEIVYSTTVAVGRRTYKVLLQALSLAPGRSYYCLRIGITVKVDDVKNLPPTRQELEKFFTHHGDEIRKALDDAFDKAEITERVISDFRAKFQVLL